MLQSGWQSEIYQDDQISERLAKLYVSSLRECMSAETKGNFFKIYVKLSGFVKIRH